MDVNEIMSMPEVMQKLKVSYRVMPGLIASGMLSVAKTGIK